MRIAVRYQSRGGNTMTVANIIARNFDVQALSINTPVNHTTDILFLGGGVYAKRMDNSLKNYIEQLPSEKIGQIVCFSTAGLMDATLKQMRTLAQAKGIIVNENELLIKMKLRGLSLLGLTGGELSLRQEEQVVEFIKKFKMSFKYIRNYTNSFS